MDNEGKKPWFLKGMTLKQKAIMLIISGFMIFIIIGFIAIRDYFFFKRALPGSGTIVSAKYYNGAGRYSTRGWALTVSYQPDNSNTAEVILWDDDQSHDVGQSVTFLYDPQNFQYVRSYGAARQFPWVPIGLLTIFSALITLGFVRYKKESEKENLFSIPS